MYIYNTVSVIKMNYDISDNHTYYDISVFGNYTSGVIRL